MTVIYDAALAAEHTQEARSLQRRRSITCWCSFFGVVVSFAVLMLFIAGVMNLFWLFMLTLLVALVSAAILLSTVLIAEDDADPAPDVIYVEKTRNCTVLDITIEHRDHGWHRNVPFVVLRTETSDGLVEQTDLCIATYRESTKYTEETFDVNKGIVYVPYKGQAAV